MQISQFFLSGDMKGALAYMRSHEAFKEILPAYTAIFEDCKYRTYEIPDMLNSVLRLYQVYFRDTFYCGLPEAEAADKLLTGLKHLLNMPDADEDTLVEQLQSVFEENGYHALFGKTQGYYGPYIWRDTVPTVYPCRIAGWCSRIHRLHSERLRVPELAGLSDLRQAGYGRLGFARRHDQLHRAGV